MEIKVLKLKTGEEIVTEIAKYDGDNVIIKNPLMFQLVPIEHMGQQQITVQAIPFIQFSKDTTFTISNDNILVICSPLESIEKEYCSKFSSITLPDSVEGKNIIQMLRK